MIGYKGEVIVDLAKSEYKDYTAEDWAKHWICSRGQIDGAHHKSRCLDEVMQILHGTPVIVKEASWKNGHSELRFSVGEPSKEYKQFVIDYEEDGEYSWDDGSH